jgi:hypothetical protein
MCFSLTRVRMFLCVCAVQRYEREQCSSESYCYNDVSAAASGQCSWSQTASAYTKRKSCTVDSLTDTELAVRTR